MQILEQPQVPALPPAEKGIGLRGQFNLLRWFSLGSFLIIAGVAGLGCAWVTAVHLRPRLKARRQAKREARNTPTPDAAAVAAAD